MQQLKLPEPLPAPRLCSAIRFEVRGAPAPQGSKKFVGMHAGRGILVESSKAVKPWRQDVAAAVAAIWRHPPIDEPTWLEMVFTLAKPLSAPKRRRIFPDRQPDLSKLARSTEDALVTAGLLRDDARIVEYVRLAKVYPGEDPRALDSPGVWINVLRALEATT